MGNGKYIDKQVAYKISDFIMTSTLIEPLQTSVKNGMDTRLFAYINKFEKQYKDKEGLWTKSLIESRSNDLSELMEKIVLKDFDD